MSAPFPTYDSVLVAKYLYACAKDKGRYPNATQLQKLLYIAYGILLAGYNRKACTESPQAWPFGPVFPRTQKRFEKIKESDLDDEELSEIKGDQQLTEAIDATIESFASLSAKSLSEWSHEAGSPWYLTKQQEGFKWGAQIPDEYIAEYFKRFIE